MQDSMHWVNMFLKFISVCDALLCFSHTLHSALESGQEARIVQIDSSAAIDRVNHQGILYKLCYVGIGGSALSILTQFLSNWSQYVMVDGCHGKLVNVISGMKQGSVGPVIIPPVHFGAFFHSGKLADRLCWLLHFNGCCAIPRRHSYISRVPNPYPLAGFVSGVTFGDEIECD